MYLVILYSIKLHILLLHIICYYIYSSKYKPVSDIWVELIGCVNEVEDVETPNVYGM